MSQDPLILIVDASYPNIQAMASILAIQPYDIAVATSGYQAMNFLCHRRADLILMEIFMPDMNGLETCKYIKSVPELVDIPVIFISSEDDEQMIVEGFENGGVDYIIRPFRTRELISRIATQLELKKTKEELYKLSRTDDLTHAYNRRYFIEYLDDYMQSNKYVHEAYCSVILFDVDDFKKINDTYGHPIGDQTLKHLASLCMEFSEPHNAVFSRLGGDEFGIILNHRKKQDIIDFVHALYQLIRHNSSHPDLGVPPFTISAGITMVSDAQHSHADVLKKADQALYKAKENGKGRPCFNH